MLTCREQVDEVVNKAKDAGGIIPNEKRDQRFMYGRVFQDLADYLWEVTYMDPATII